MIIKPLPETHEQPGRLAAIFDSDKDGYFKNLTALAAKLCPGTFATLLTPVNNRLVCLANYGFDDTCILQPLPFDKDHFVFEDLSKITTQPIEVNGHAISFFAGFKVFTEADTEPLWLCVMNHHPSSFTIEQLSQLNMLAKQATAVHNLLANNILSNIGTQVEKKLQEQKTFYEKILNQIPTDIAVFDANHKYLFVNPGAISVEELRNYIIGKDDYEYAAYRNRDISIADSRRAQFLHVKQTGKEIRWEESITRPDGTVITVLRYLFPVVESNGEVSLVIGYGLNITDRKALEEKQAELVKQLSSQNTQLIDFCNIVSHNLRAPLVNMSMLVDFMKETDDVEEYQLLFDKLGPVIENLHTTFNELVESIQIKQDLEIDVESLNLSDVLERTLQGLATEMNTPSVNVRYDFNEAPQINFPPKYLHSIFYNFLSNASKYRSPHRKLSIDISSNQIGDKIVLKFTDNGLGIDLVKHGDKLFKIGKVFHHHADAKGFGLYMTKTQVEAMNGRIWVESVPNVGSTFFIEFPNQG
jgi:signal transduction histidine kinase